MFAFHIFSLKCCLHTNLYHVNAVQDDISTKTDHNSIAVEDGSAGDEAVDDVVVGGHLLHYRNHHMEIQVVQW